MILLRWPRLAVSVMHRSGVHRRLSVRLSHLLSNVNGARGVFFLTLTGRAAYT